MGEPPPVYNRMEEHAQLLSSMNIVFFLLQGRGMVHSQKTNSLPNKLTLQH